MHSASIGFVLSGACFDLKAYFTISLILISFIHPEELVSVTICINLKPFFFFFALVVVVLKGAGAGVWSLKLIGLTPH